MSRVGTPERERPMGGGVFVAGEAGKVQFDKDLAQLVQVLDLYHAMLGAARL